MTLPGLLSVTLAALTTAPQQAPTPWQQGVSYRIEARLDEDAEVLTGRARLTYRNESPDTLTDFYLHLYLNAFRPNSEWARTDLKHGVRTFQDLDPDEQGFERLQRISVDGRQVAVSYPWAPDSTVVRLALPEPLPPSGEITLDYDWQSRPSTVPRRQGRNGRHYDFAQWYPRVAVYDLEGWRPHPLYRQGEFYSEFATYDVTLDLAQDQVMGATGVPVEGDPGWEHAAVPGTGPIDYQRDWYGGDVQAPCVERDGVRTCGIPSRELAPADSLGLLGSPVRSGRKRVRWHAENVHHFAWSTAPDYIYEQGAFDGAAIHVLYRPGDEAEWGHGVAVQRTEVALQWLGTLYGEYPYPQVTNVHRLEGGGTEFPMMVMDGSASQGLILHEVGHIYTFGILANNEWYEGWLDEGFTSFQTAWFDEERGGGRAQWLRSEMQVLDLELHHVAEPVTLQAERYREMTIYNRMIYTKGSLVFWMLREMVGKERMVEILRTYFQRYKFRHVDQHAFQSVAEEVSRRDLDWFFGEWLHANGVADYALRGVDIAPDRDGWVTKVQVARQGDMRMPVPLRLQGAGDGAVRDTVVPGDALQATHVIRTPFRPQRVRLDPELVTMDWDALDNTWPSGPLSGSTYVAGLDNPFGTLPIYRDRAALRFFPLAWYNDAGGVVGGVQVRSSYLGDTRRVLLRLGLPGVSTLGVGDSTGGVDPGSVYLRLDDPVLFHRPRFGLSVEAFGGEGRGYFQVAGERDVSPWPLAFPRRFVRSWVTVAGVYDSTYVVPGRWSPAHHVSTEAGLGFRTEGTTWTTGLDGAAGVSSDDRVWFRGAVIAEAQAEGEGGWRAGLRLFGGAVMARQAGVWHGGRAPRERQFFLFGGDPYRRLSDPWARSAGAPLEKTGDAPGGGRLLGYDPSLAFAQLLTLTGDVTTRPASLGSGGRGLDLRARIFAGAGIGSAPSPFVGPDPLPTGALDGVEAWNHLYASAGAGLVLGLRGSPVEVGVDFPLLVRDVGLDSRRSPGRLAFRYTVRVATSR